MDWSPCRSLALLASVSIIGCGGDDPVGPTVPTDGLVVFLPFSGNANDRSGSANHGAVYDGSTSAGYLLLGNNITDVLTLPGSSMDGLNDFSVAAWVRIDTLRGENHMLMSGANAIEDNMIGIFYDDASNVWEFMVDDGYDEFASDTSIEDGQWHHLAVTRSGSTARLFLDGAQVGGSITVPTDVLDIDPDGLVFGQDQDVVGGGFEADEAWAGAMDNLRIYDRALTGAEITVLTQEAHS